MVILHEPSKDKSNEGKECNLDMTNENTQLISFLKTNDIAFVLTNSKEYELTEIKQGKYTIYNKKHNVPVVINTKIKGTSGKNYFAIKQLFQLEKHSKESYMNRVENVTQILIERLPSKKVELVPIFLSKKFNQIIHVATSIQMYLSDAPHAVIVDMEYVYKGISYKDTFEIENDRQYAKIIAAYSDVLTLLKTENTEQPQYVTYYQALHKYVNQEVSYLLTNNEVKSCVTTIASPKQKHKQLSIYKQLFTKDFFVPSKGVSKHYFTLDIENSTGKKRKYKISIGIYKNKPRIYISSIGVNNEYVYSLLLDSDKNNHWLATTILEDM